MNISPINSFNISKSYKNTSFKGNNGSSEPIQPSQPNQSMQNNSPDFFIPTEAYLNMYSNGMIKDMEKEGLFQFAPEDLAEIDTESLEAGDFTGALGSFLSSDAMAEKSARTSIFGLKQQGLTLLRGLDENKRDKVPMFVNVSPESFAKMYIDNMNKLQNVDAQDLASIASDELGGEISEGIQSILDIGMSIFQNEDYLDSIRTMQEGMLELFETKYKDELKEALNIYSTGLNCLLYGIIESSFDRSPKDVINLLANNAMVYTQPEIKDNEDGTSTLTYVFFGTVYEVTRNNANGDYIKAQGKDYSGQLFNVDFRKDGSLQKLDYRSNISNTSIIIESDENNSSFKVTQDIKEGACQRTFNRKSNGTLELADFKIFTK